MSRDDIGYVSALACEPRSPFWSSIIEPNLFEAIPGVLLLLNTVKRTPSNRATPSRVAIHR